MFSVGVLVMPSYQSKANPLIVPPDIVIARRGAALRRRAGKQERAVVNGDVADAVAGGIRDTSDVLRRRPLRRC